MQENTNITPPLHTNVGKKQAYYYRTISPTQIAGLADAILEKVFGFEQVPDMVTLTANEQGHFDFKAQFMYEDSIPFPQKRSTASKEKEKQKVKEIALAFFRQANEKVKANKQPKLENQDSTRQMFRDKDVDRGAFPSDFPDLFPIQYLEWQSTEPIFHAEYPKNIHYYEVRFRVELPVIATGRFGSAQRPAVEKIENDSVQNPETPVARLSSSAPTNHAPQTQKLADIERSRNAATEKATVQNEYIVLHINPDDKRYEIMGVFSYFVQIAGQEITDLLQRGDFDLCFRQQGNLKVPFYIDGVAASGLVGEENSQKVINNDTNVIGVIRIFLVIEDNTIAYDKWIEVGFAVGTELYWFELKLTYILAINNISAQIHVKSKEQIDEMQISRQLKGNDYIINILNTDRLYTEGHTSETDQYDLNMGVTLINGNNPNSKLTEYNTNNAHPECPIFIPYQYCAAYFKPTPKDAPQACYDELTDSMIYPPHPTYKILDEVTFFDMMAYVCAHELYHAISFRALKFAALKKTGILNYEFGEPYPTDFTAFDKYAYFTTGVTPKQGEVDNYNKSNAFGHSFLDDIDMIKRSQQYSLNTSGEHTVHVAFLTDMKKYEDSDPTLAKTYAIPIQQMIDIFFVNPYLKIDEDFITANNINKDELPMQIREAIEGKDDMFYSGELKQGSAFGLMHRFRSDELNIKFVIPFLSHFQA